MVLANAGLGFFALKKLEKKAGGPIRGTFLPHVVFPSFTLKNARLDWEGRFQVLSGTVVVRYDPSFVIPGRKLRVWITGRDLEVRLAGKLVEGEGLSSFQGVRVDADLAFPYHGPPEIFLFDVQSDQMKFRLAKD